MEQKWWCPTCGVVWVRADWEGDPPGCLHGLNPDDDSIEPATLEPLPDWHPLLAGAAAA